jgi:hypothetical protein
MVLLLGDVDDAVIAREATRREWVLARLHGARLDHELACGASPEASAEIALRAQYLVRPQTRRMLAQTLRRILAEAARGRTAPVGPLPLPTRRRVVAARRELETLIERLLAPCPVPACGVAKVRVLVTEGCGPLYHPAGPGDLRTCLVEAANALEPLDHF